MNIVRNILIVEPSVEIRAGLRSRLEDMEQNVQCASSSAEALAMIEWHGLPDLILVSTKLSYRTGEHFLEAVRELPFYVWTPAFQLFAPGDKSLPGVSGFLELPASTRKLQAMLNSVDVPEARIFERTARPFWRSGAALATL